MSNRNIIIGDVHGCLLELEALLKKLDVSQTDKLYFVGDLLDRGPYGAECIKLVRTLPNTKMCLANHEERARRWLQHEAKAKKDPTYQNKMKHYSAKDIKAIQALSSEDEAWLKQLPTYVRFSVEWTEPPTRAISKEDYIVVHGGFFPHYPIDKQDLKAVCRLRNIDKTTYQMIPFKFNEQLPENAIFWDEVWPGPEKVIYGHEPRNEVKLTKYCYGIDTSACFGGKLTAMVINEHNRISFESISAFEKYADRSSAQA